MAVVRGFASAMSEVISFRLNPENPREAQALEILRIKKSEGFSSRQILTDALIGVVTDKEELKIIEFNTALEQVQGLIESLKSNNHDQSQSTSPQSRVGALNDNFLNSVKIAVKPGMKLD